MRGKKSLCVHTNKKIVIFSTRSDPVTMTLKWGEVSWYALEGLWSYTIVVSLKALTVSFYDYKFAYWLFVQYKWPWPCNNTYQKQYTMIEHLVICTYYKITQSYFSRSRSPLRSSLGQFYQFLFFKIKATFKEFMGSML